VVVHLQPLLKTNYNYVSCLLEATNTSVRQWFKLLILSRDNIFFASQLLHRFHSIRIAVRDVVVLSDNEY
jgi:hypothetical protein